MLRWRYKHLSNSQFINIVSIIVGLLAGLAAVFIKNLTHFIQVLLEGNLIKDIHQAFYFIFPIIGFGMVYIIKKKIIKKKLGQGIPSTLYAISKQKGILPRYQSWSSLITAPLTVGFGGSVGLEAPTVSTAASLSSNFARFLHLNQKTRTLLIGAAAAGAMASISAVLTSYFFFGNDVLLHFTLTDKFQLEDVSFYVVLGIFCSLISIYFTKTHFAIINFLKTFKKGYSRLFVGGSILGVIVFFVPPLFGEGYEVMNNILLGNVESVINNNFFEVPIDDIWTIGALLFGLVLLKIVATSSTIGAGGVGGIFAPTLFTGSISGYIFALFANYSGLFDHQLSLTNFAMVGMAGLMAGILHAPLTAIFMIAEITGGYELFVPLMIVASSSYLITRKYMPHSIYNKELAKRGELITHNKDKNVLMLMDIDKVIETNFIVLKPEMTLGEVVNNAVAKSSRNHFPVVNDEDEFLGIITLDDIRSIMFDTNLYDEVKVHSLMSTVPEIIDYDRDTMEVIMKKFKRTAAWNLPVVENNKYAGFISKSRLLTAYRQKLINVTN